MSVFTISPRFPFADTLAGGVLQVVGTDPMELARVTILLPTRRAQRTVREAFLRQSNGQPLMLPRLLALGDLDDDEVLFSGFQGLGPAEETIEALAPALPPLRRRLLLARLVMAKGDESGKAYTPDQALRLADELARLLDQVQTEGCSFKALPDLAPDRYAAHWTQVVEFLNIIAHLWPSLLEAESCLDPAERRNRLLRAQARAWSEQPPAGRIIAAGITGSVPAAADLLAVVATLPGGMVVLPGLDQDLDDDAWQAIDDSHPQHALKRLLTIMKTERAAVADWPYTPPEQMGKGSPLASPQRVRLISEALRPAQTTHRWRELSHGTPPLLTPEAVAGVERIDCPSPREEALAIALIMRQTLETPEKTAALVTPDRDLARRVAADLARWGIRVDDSAGRPLAVTPPGAFLRLTAAMVAEDFAPVALLAVLKHPLAGAGMDSAVFRDAIRRLELAALRGVRPAPGIVGLRAALSILPPDEEQDLLQDDASAAPSLPPSPSTSLAPLLTALETCCQPFVEAMASPQAPFSLLLEAHMRLAEALAATAEEHGALRLWAKDAGDAAATWARDLADAAAVLGDVPTACYPALINGLMAGVGVRQEFGNHPRLAILGPMEARLRHADVVIIGSLNENIWPPQTAVDPWMSRPMRGEFGLPQPEQRVGHAAHDFASLFCAPRVIMTRANKNEGSPTVPSRWLLRLDTVLTAASLEKLGSKTPWVAMAEALDKPVAYTPGKRPAPCPPVPLRPRRLSVTRIETWMRDPYAIYAEYILGLKALKPLDDSPGSSDYGSLVHKALELFARSYPHDLPADPYRVLIECGQQAFVETIARPSVRAFWWPRFERLARWVVEKERERRPGIRSLFVETKGSLDLGTFTLTAKADRLELLQQDGSLVIIDYKTGSPPSQAEVFAGFAPQLPLEALMAEQGAFGEHSSQIPARPVSGLEFWHLKGNHEGGEEKPLKFKTTSLPELVREAQEGLIGLISAFDRPETPYLARPHPEKAPKYSDYGHLARIREWSSETEGASE